MQSRKIKPQNREDLVYDPSRRAPVKPPALWTFRKLSGWTMAKPICTCPHCEGTGFHFELEDELSQHSVKCQTCSGTGKMTEGEFNKLYFDIQIQYRVDFEEWRRYSEVLRKIKRKLDKREKVFLGLTNWFDEKENGRDF
jgi:hypothetical protein